MKHTLVYPLSSKCFSLCSALLDVHVCARHQYEKSLIYRRVRYTCCQRVDTWHAQTLWNWEEKHFWDRSLLSEFFLTLHSLFCQVYTIQMTTSPKYPIRSNALWEVHSSFSWMLQSSPSPNSWSHLLLLHLCWREHFQSTLNRGSYRFQEDA